MPHAMNRTAPMMHSCFLFVSTTREVEHSSYQIPRPEKPLNRKLNETVWMAAL